MNFTDLLSLLKDASPWVVLGITTLGLAWLYSDYRKAKLKHAQKKAERSELVQLFDAAERILDGVTAFKTQLENHTHDDQRMIQGIEHANHRIAEGMEQMVRQLISLNAASAGKVLSQANSRTVIQYQWRWCRDETIRILITSIERNHIEGREQAVALQVFRAWKRAANETKTSIEKLEGLAYDPQILLNPTTLNKIWNVAWAKALPIYFRDFPLGSGSLEDHQTELVESVKALFDQAFDEFVACLYEADHGGGDGRVATRSEANIPANADDLNAVAQMVTDMREYRTNSGKHLALYPPNSDNLDRLAVRTTIEAAAKASTKLRPPNI